MLANEAPVLPAAQPGLFTALARQDLDA